MYKFEQLRVWQEGLILIKSIYFLCNALPKNEQNNLVDQLKRATTSICLNIAEGSASQNDKEFRRYLYIAKKSLFESVSILKIITYLYKRDTLEQQEKASQLLKQLVNLIKYLDKNVHNP